MAATPVEIIHGVSGLSGTLKLYPRGSDSTANGAGDAVTEQTNRKGVYRATVDDALTGLHEAYFVDGSGNVLFAGCVRLTDTTSVHTVSELTVSGDVPDGEAGDVSISAPASPDCTTGYVLCLGTDGLPEAGVTIIARIVSGPGTAGYALDRGLITMTSDGAGLAQHSGFVRGAYYKFKRGTDDWLNHNGSLAPDAGSWQLPEILGMS